MKLGLVSCTKNRTASSMLQNDIILRPIEKRCEVKECNEFSPSSFHLLHTVSQTAHTGTGRGVITSLCSGSSMN